MVLDSTIGSAGRQASDYHRVMYLDAMEFLEDERDSWAPFEALDGLPDEAIVTPVETAHGWSGRELMAHLLAWQGVVLEIAKELAVDDTSPTIARVDADWKARGGEVVNAEIAEQWAAIPLTALRERFRTQPGELRGYLTVVPEARWLKDPANLKAIREDTIEHYADHVDDLRAILAAAGAAPAPSDG
jgi:hypothetical protein